MSLLPLNESKELHKLDEYFGKRIDYLNQLNLIVHPLYVEKKYLKLLSIILDIDIVGLTESEARELLSLFIELQKYAGTVYVLKKVMSIFFNDVVLNDQIGNYEFDFNVELKNDVSAEKLNKIKTLANKYKNVRSKLRNIIINLPLLQTEIKLNSACVFGLDIDSKSLIQQEFNAEIHLKSGCSFRLNFNTSANLEDLKSGFYKQGGLLWRL